MRANVRIVIVCDGCGRQGPVIENGRVVRVVDEWWRAIALPDGVRNFCPDCSEGPTADATAKRAFARFN